MQRKPLLKKLYFLKKEIILLSLTYLILRFINLTSVPIFNDESIYLDWGWREITVPGLLYYSLYDGKQPLLMWIFGVMQQIIDDPLLAGRGVSILFGLFAMLGLYFVGKEIKNKKAGLIAAILYTIIPIFSFYDRQALMESSIAAVGVWSLYFLIKYFKENLKLTYLLFGSLILGLGFFIKSSSLIFIATFIIIFVTHSIKRRSSFSVIVLGLITISAGILISDFLLILNPYFWTTIEMNTRYSLSFSDLFKFPISIWATNTYKDLSIIFFFVTPPVLFFAIFALIKKINYKNKEFLILVFWFVISIFLQILLTRNTSQRYLVSFLPPITLIASFYIVDLIKNRKHVLVIGSFLLIPFIISLFQIFSPLNYFNLYKTLTPTTENEYFIGTTSGFGVKETIDFIKKDSMNKQVFIGLAKNTGNPESAVIVYFNGNKKFNAGYLDGSYFTKDLLNKTECLSSDYPIYFVSRDYQLAGLEKFFEEKTRFKHPLTNNSIGIYKLKENCKGKTFPLKWRMG